MKFIDSARFTARSLSSLVDKLAEPITKLNVKIVIVTERSIKYECTSCNKDYSNKIDNELKKNDLLTHLSFLIMISTNLFCC